MDFAAMREKLHDYETIIETMHCGLVARDLHGTVVFSNQRLLDWLSYTREEVEGQPMDMFVPRELRELFREDLEAAGDDDLRARLLVLRRKDGTTLPVVAIPQRFTNASGDYDGYFSIVIDLGTVLTARQIGPIARVDLRATLSRIAMELQSISLSAQGPLPTPVPLHHPDLSDLSPREVEVVSHLVSGLRVPAIAERLHISQHTVRNHPKSAFRKVGVGSQSELIDRVRSLVDDGVGGEAPAS